MSTLNLKEAVKLRHPNNITKAFNDMFETEKTQSNDETKQPEMEFSRMKSFPNHIFKLYEGEKFEEMVESIKTCGILVAITLWKTDDNEYIILSGHNRVNAAKAVGLTKGPVYIKTNITQDEATFYVTETNLKQRAFLEMSHTERALCLSQNFNCLKNQGRRNDLINEIEALLNPHGERDRGTSAEVQRKLETKDKIAEKNGISRDKVAKYIRIATLVPDFLEFLDTKKIAFLAAYDISFIEDKTKQTLIAEIVKRDDCKIDMKKAALLREYYEKNKLTDKAIEDIIAGIRVGKNPGPKSYKVRPVVLKKFFTGEETQDEIDDTVTRALAMFFESQNSEQGENENLA